MARRQVPIEFNRREFIEMAAAAGVACTATDAFSDEFVVAKTDRARIVAQAGRAAVAVAVSLLRRGLRHIDPGAKRQGRRHGARPKAPDQPRHPVHQGAQRP